MHKSTTHISITNNRKKIRDTYLSLRQNENTDIIEKHEINTFH